MKIFRGLPLKPRAEVRVVQHPGSFGIFRNFFRLSKFFKEIIRIKWNKTLLLHYPNRSLSLDTITHVKTQLSLSKYLSIPCIVDLLGELHKCQPAEDQQVFSGGSDTK